MIIVQKELAINMVMCEFFLEQRSIIYFKESRAK